MKRAKEATPRILVREYYDEVEVTRGEDGKLVPRVLSEKKRGLLYGGTGVLVSKNGQYGNVVTNSHVLPVIQKSLQGVDDKGEPRFVARLTSAYEAFVIFPQPKGSPRIYRVKERLLHSNIEGHAMSVGGDETADVAVLRIAARGLPEPLPFEDRSLGDAQNVYALGYPGVLDSTASEEVACFIEDRWKEINSTDDTYFTVENLTNVEQFLNVAASKGSVSRLVDQAGALGKVYHSATISHGNSGGPLIDDQGHIVGINTWGRRDGDGGDWFISMSASTVIGMLKTNGLPYHLASDIPAPAAKAPESKSSATGIYIAIGVGCVVFVGIIATLLLSGGKDKEIMKIVVSTGERLVITEKMLKQGEIKLGRSSDCPLRLYDEHISKWHACIVKGNDGICIMDIGSKAGTKVNGKDLAPRCQYSLRKGDVIEFGKIKARVQ